MAEIAELTFADRPLRLETGSMARQADAAVLVKYGDTMALVTACASKHPLEGVDFLPLRVDFEEKMYAVGRIPGGFFKREGRPTEEATRTMGVIDKAVRPLLPKGLRNDVQIIATALSADQQNSPDVACVLGASAALALSSIPFGGPCAAAEVGRRNGEFIFNPSFQEIEEGDLHVLIIGTREGVVSVEVEAKQVPEEAVADAVAFGQQHLEPVIALLEEFRQHAGVPKSDDYFIWELNEEIHTAVRAAAEDELRAALQTADKLEQRARLRALKQRILTGFAEQYPDQGNDVFESLERLETQLVQGMVLQENRRPDGRAFDEVRELRSDVGFLPRAHGSGLFTRGDTQVLTVATLGAVRDQKLVRSLMEEEYKRFMHQYNFPPYSSGEVRPLRAPSRREIRHGMLAQASLEPVLPDEEAFPYTIRLVSEVLESNSSSSMAAVCGSALALMDAGVPIAAPVAGVGMGLVMEGDRYRILTDIQYIEDASGHMDFKVAGTRDGITAIHLDIKKPGLPLQVLREALAQAREARLRILDNMEMALPAPRPDISPYAPRMISMRVDTTQIGLVIGPGGRTIRKIEADFGVDIDIEDDGTVTISSPGGKGAQEARQYIEDLTRTIEVGEEFAARVVSTKPFGAFVELIPGKEALLHISDIAWEHVDKTEDVLNVGDEVQVKVTEVNDDGKLRVSRKVLLARGEGFGRERRNGGPDRRPGGDHRREGSDRRREGGDRGRSGARPPRREGSGGEGGGPKPYFREKKRED